MYSLHPLATEIVRLLYPEDSAKNPIHGYTLNEIAFCDCYTDKDIKDVSLQLQIGSVTLNIPILGAAMDTVSGPAMASALSAIGGAAIIYRHRLAKIQLRWIKDALETKPGLVATPECVQQTDTIAKVEETHKRTGYSTIPVLAGKKLAGMIFTRDITYAGHEKDPVSKWMMPRDKLKVASPETSFAVIRERLLNEKDCRVLPVVSKDDIFHGMYFMKDIRHTAPAWHNGKPLVGMAIGIHDEDLKRVRQALKLGVGIIVIDSSHGNCLPVIRQAKRVVKIVGDQATVIAGNVASIDGYIRLAEVGVHAVKAGIGSGSICTTSQVTGVGVPMWTLIRELAFTQKQLSERGHNAPAIIADGGVSGPGFAVRALAAGAHAVMAGEWMAAADEAGSPDILNARRDVGGAVFNRYRGMASKSAIKDRASDRYGITKSAPEGVDGWVQNRGKLRHWLPDDIELMRGGLAHLGVKDLTELHIRGNEPYVWRLFTGTGQQQMATRVITTI